MANGEMKQFPKGAIAMDNGDLVQVQNAKLSYKNSAKLKHSLTSMDPVGTVTGPREGTLSFESEISEVGSERDYFELCKSGAIKQIRFKVPGKTYVCTGTFESVDFDLSIDDAVKVSLQMICKITSK